jgi:hypothetical protein
MGLALYDPDKGSKDVRCLNCDREHALLRAISADLQFSKKASAFIKS